VPFSYADIEERKWRLVVEPTLPVDNKEQVVSSKMRRNHEHYRNKAEPCKTPCDVETKIQTAALWLAVHRDECKTAIIPFVRKRFSLTILEAIEALKIGHKLSMGGNR
jgi:hypothetical protein